MLDFGNIELVERIRGRLRRLSRAAKKKARDIDEWNAYFVEVKRGIEDITGDVTG